MPLYNPRLQELQARFHWNKDYFGTIGLPLTLAYELLRHEKSPSPFGATRRVRFSGVHLRVCAVSDTDGCN